MKNKWLRIMIITVIGVLLVCCISVALFVNWDNQPENVAAAVQRHATQTAQGALDAAATNTTNAAATQEMQSITERLKKANPVFAETFDANSAFLKQNTGSLSITMNDGVPDILLPFNGDNVWPVGKDLKDFVAEVDCAPAGNGTFCGIAYDIHPKDQQPNGTFYGSYTSYGGNCGFDDLTGSFSVSKSWSCTPPQSPAAGSLNRLRVERFGQHLRFYVNGQLMDERLLTGDYASGGDVGLYFGRASDNSGGDSNVMVDNLKVWALP